MNANNARKLADAIEQDAAKFDQRKYGHLYLDHDGSKRLCGSAGCIAGWIMCMFPDLSQYAVPGHGPEFMTGMAVLELTESQATSLFSQCWPVSWLRFTGGIAPDPFDGIALPGEFVPNNIQAAAALRHFAETGSVPVRGSDAC